MELIFIGEKFYLESGSAMSPIYTVEGERTDWGFVQIALNHGDSVHIRQATEKEKMFYDQKLADLKEKRI